MAEKAGLLGHLRSRCSLRQTRGGFSTSGFLPPFGDYVLLNGGEGGIRTRGTLLRFTSLAKKRFRPLSHFSLPYKTVIVAES